MVRCLYRHPSCFIRSSRLMEMQLIRISFFYWILLKDSPHIEMETRLQMSFSVSLWSSVSLFVAILWVYRQFVSLCVCFLQICGHFVSLCWQVKCLFGILRPLMSVLKLLLLFCVSVMSLFVSLLLFYLCLPSWACGLFSNPNMHAYILYPEYFHFNIYTTVASFCTAEWAQ